MPYPARSARGCPRLKARAEAEGQRLKATFELQAIEERAKAAAAHTVHPAHLLLEQLAAL